MLWSRPEKARRTDAPALANPARLREWADSLTVASLLDLANRDCTVSQALLGTPVLVREMRGDWVKIAVPGQSTPQDAAGYPGWIPARQLMFSADFVARENWPFVQIRAPKTPLYADDALHYPINEAVYDTRLPYLASNGVAYAALLPDGSMAWVARKDSAYFRSMSALPPPTGAELLRRGHRFLGAPYLWGGITPYGFDCSGLMYTLFHAHGITLPRDTPQQFEQGVAVGERDLRPGDLLFFGKGGRQGRVHHVGLYAGDRRMLHAPNPRRTVRIAPLQASGFEREYIGARRVF